MKTKEEIQEQARLFAESKMPENWDRKDQIAIGVFYKYFTDYILEAYAQQQSPVTGYREQIMKLDYYGWTRFGMKENPKDVPMEDVFVLRQDVLNLIPTPPVQTPFKVLRTGEDITDKCTFKDGVITVPE